MFNLFGSSEKTKKYFMGGILVLVSLSMLLYLVPSYDRNSGLNDTLVAQIGSDKISEMDVRHAIQVRTRGQKLPPEVLPNYVPQMINEIIVDHAMAYEAQHLGLEVTNQDMADAMRQMYSGLFPDGKFVGKDIYAAMLAQQGTTIDEFETGLRRDMLIARLRQVALEGTIVTPAEIESDYRHKNEQLKIEFVKIPLDKFKKEAEPTEAQIAQYFKDNSSRYTIPQKKNLVLLVADQAKIEAGLNPSDADLQAAYNQNISNYRVDERVQVRHILLMTQGKPASDDAKIKAKAEDLLKQLRAGANFADLATKNSEDTGSAAKGGDLGWIVHGQTVPEFDKVAFSLKPGQISDLVKTQYGYHIIQVQAHEPAHVKPFAEVKDEIAKGWKQAQATKKIQQISDTAQAALQKDPTHPDQVAAALGMQVVHADGVQAGAALPEIGPSADFDQAIAGLKKGDVSPVIPVSATKIALAEVTDVIPQRPANLDEVKEQIKGLLAQQNLTHVMADKAKQLVESTKANGGDLAKAAKAMGLEAKTSDTFKRNANIDGFGSATYVDDAFNKPDGTILNPIPMPDGTMVVQVISHVGADMSGLPAERDKIREELKVQKARIRGNLFQGGLVDELERKGTLKVNQDVINRIVASFRG